MESKKNTLPEMGARFKEIRTKCGFTQEQIANFLELDRTMITKFEKGERSLGIADLERACGLFGCNLKVLRGLQEFEPMTVAYRAKELTLEDMEAVRNVQRIVLNLRRIKAYQEEKDEVGYTA